MDGLVDEVIPSRATNQQICLRCDGVVARSAPLVEWSARPTWARYNKSLDASGVSELVIDNLSVMQLTAAASTQPFGLPEKRCKSPTDRQGSALFERGGAMDQKMVIVMNWMALALLLPATIILVWKMVSEKLRGKGFSSDLITVSLVLGLTVIGVIQLNLERGVNWLRWVLLVAQLLLLVVLYKRVWPPFIQKLRR